MADEVVGMLMQGRIPSDNMVPREGFEAHMKRIQEIMQEIQADPMSSENSKYVVGLIHAYGTRLFQKQQEAMQQQQLLQQAQQFQQQLGGPGQPGPQAQGAPPSTGTAGNAPVNSGELIDESMPGA